MTPIDGNPQSPDEKDQRVRQRAHELWEAEGRPSGRAEAHWQQAEQELQAVQEPGSDREAIAEATNYGMETQETPSDVLPTVADPMPRYAEKP
jgi:hypothetical protein